MLKNRFLWLLFLGYLSLPYGAYGTDYHFVAIDHSAIQQVGERVLPKLYGRLGLSIVVTPMAGKRAQLESSSGLKDGEVLRIWSYGEEFGDTVRVPTSYYQLTTTAYVRKNSGIQIEHVEDLKHYRLVKVSGVRHTHDITEHMDNVVDVKTPMEMMHYLNNERADIALTSRLGGDYIIRQLGLDNIVAIETPLKVLPLYHYLYQRHSSLVDQVDQVIIDAKASGQLQAWIDEAERAIIQINDLSE